jgi:hypothetical protein
MLDEATTKLVDEVAGVAGKVGGGATMQLRPHERGILALFDRCRSTFGAVRVLAKVKAPDFGQEALILVRPLLTESLMLMELAEADETRRVELVVGWELASLDDLEGLMREAQTRGHRDDDTRLILDDIASQRRVVETYARELGARTRKWKVNEKTLAEKHGRDDYLSFRMTHHFVHGSTFAASQRYSKKGDIYLVGGPAADTGWAWPAALQAADSVLYATRAVCTIFDWEPPAELDDLEKQIANLDAETKAGAARPIRPSCS